MTITHTDAAQVIKYLHAAGALIAVEDQEVVWSDYINHEVPDAKATDLLPAVRDCLRRWAAQKRTWTLDLPRYVQSIRHVRRERVRAALGDEALLPMGDFDGYAYLEWVRTAHRVLGDGATREQAEAEAWRHLETQGLRLDVSSNTRSKTGRITEEENPRETGISGGVTD